MHKYCSQYVSAQPTQGVGVGAGMHRGGGHQYLNSHIYQIVKMLIQNEHIIVKLYKKITIENYQYRIFEDM